MATKLSVGQKVKWSVRGNAITGVVREVKPGGWYKVEAQTEEGSSTYLGFRYVVQARHIQPQASQ